MSHKNEVPVKPLGTSVSKRRLSAATVVGLVLIVGWMLAGAPAQAVNLLANPGLEIDPPGQATTIPGWTRYGGNTYGQTGGSAHTGTNYFKVYQGFISAVNYNGIYQDYLSVPGTTYSAEGWAFTSGAAWHNPGDTVRQIKIDQIF